MLKVPHLPLLPAIPLLLDPLLTSHHLVDHLLVHLQARVFPHLATILAVVVPQHMGDTAVNETVVMDDMEEEEEEEEEEIIVEDLGEYTSILFVGE